MRATSGLVLTGSSALCQAIGLPALPPATKQRTPEPEALSPTDRPTLEPGESTAGSRRVGSDSPLRRQAPTERYVADRQLKSMKEQLEDEERAAKVRGYFVISTEAVTEISLRFYSFHRRLCAAAVDCDLPMSSPVLPMR
jgi:hypothetical protein